MFDYVEEKLESLVKIIFWVLTVLSIIGFLIYSLLISSTLDAISYYSDTGSLKFVYILFALIVTGAFIALYYICTLMILSYLNLVGFARATASTLNEISEKMDYKGVPSKQSNSSGISANANIPKSGEWKCNKCGKINPNYVGTCGCGTPRV